MILPKLKEMDNKQLYNFTREQTQVFLTGLLGDGCISTTNSGSYIYTTNCKHLEYLEFKKKLLGKGNIKLQERKAMKEDHGLSRASTALDNKAFCTGLSDNPILVPLDSTNDIRKSIMSSLIFKNS